MNNYPEHNKLKAIDSVQKETVQDFIDWLYDESKYWIAEEDRCWQGLQSTSSTREQIMAEYFGIDLQKLSSEKDRILDDWREKQGL
jgi:hypothetical protein